MKQRDDRRCLLSQGKVTLATVVVHMAPNKLREVIVNTVDVRHPQSGSVTAILWIPALQPQGHSHFYVFVTYFISYFMITSELRRDERCAWFEEMLRKTWISQHDV